MNSQASPAYAANGLMIDNFAFPDPVGVWDDFLFFETLSTDLPQVDNVVVTIETAPGMEFVPWDYDPSELHPITGQPMHQFGGSDVRCVGIPPGPGEINSKGDTAVCTVGTIFQSDTVQLPVVFNITPRIDAPAGFITVSTNPQVPVTPTGTPLDSSFTCTNCANPPIPGFNDPFNGGVAPANPTITGTVVDNESEITSVELSINGGAFVQANFNVTPPGIAGTWTYVANGLPDGTHTFEVRAVDSQGNVGTATGGTVEVDSVFPTLTVPPDVTLEIPANISPTNTGVATGSDANPATPFITYTDSPALDGTAVGVIDRTWAATDLAGNVQTGVQKITLVATPATVSLTKLITPVGTAPNDSFDFVFDGTTATDIPATVTVTNGATETIQIQVPTGAEYTLNEINLPAGYAFDSFNSNNAAITDLGVPFTLVPGTGSVNIIVGNAYTAPNLPTTADDQSVSTPEDIALPITLTGNDPDDPITFAIDTNPTNGVLTGTAPNLTYTPNENYNGPDSFTFTVTGSTVATGTITINVTPVDDDTTADDQSVSTPEDTALPITLTGSDVDDTVTFATGTGPTNGVLTGTAPNLTYTPNENYNGPDSFTFTVTGSTVATGTITINVTPVDDAPTADDQSVSTPEDTALPITLTGGDIDSPFTFSIINQPQNGVLSGTAPNLTYTPNQDYNGIDFFSYQVSGSGLPSSATGTITINVTPVDDAPTADDQSLITPEDTSLTVTLTGTDTDDALSYSIASGPSNGSLGPLTLSDLFTVKSIPVAGVTPNGVALNTITDTLYLSYGSPTNLVVGLDPGSLSGKGPSNGFVSVGANAHQIGVNENTNTYYVSNQADNTVSVIDGATNTVTATIPVGTGPIGVAVNPSTNTVYVANSPAGTLSVINGATNTVTATIPTGVDSPGVTVDSTTNTIYVGQSTSPSGLVYVIDGATNTVTTTIPVAAHSGGLSVNPNTDRLYVASSNPGTSTVSVIDTNLNTVLTTIPVGEFARVITVNPNTGLVYVTTDSPGTLSVIDGATNTVTSTLSAGSFTQSIAVDPNTSRIFTADSGSQTITVAEHRANVTYTPNQDYNGPDSFTFTATGGSQSDNGTITINVTPVDDDTTADDQSVSTPEDTALPITLTGSDVDDTVTFATGTGPTNGVLTGTAPNLTYTPNENYNGPDSFTFTVTGSTVATGTITINVTPVDDDTTADDQSVSTPEDTALPITLTGSDVDDTVTFATGTGPTNGVLTGTAPNLTYTPNENYNGPDSFTFTVTGSTVATGTITINVTPVDDDTTADDQSVSTPEDTALPITLTGSDVDDTVTFATGTGPTNGVLTGTAPNLTYTPNENYNGPDSFTFTVTGSTVATGTITINVTPVDDDTTADDQSVSTPEDTALPITLTGSDVDDTVTFATGTGPTNGVLTGTAPNLTYTPNENYNGPDSFTFTVTGSTVATGTITINVTPVDDDTTADDQSVSTPEDTALPITLTGSDVDDTVTFATGTGPTNGVLTGTAPNLTYTPNENYNGPDSFTFTVTGSTVATGTITINVTPVNDPPPPPTGGPQAPGYDPLTNPNTVTTPENTEKDVFLSGTDVENDNLTFTTTTPPANGSVGTVTSTGATTATVTYTPDDDFVGTDTFGILVDDNNGGTAPAIITVIVTPVDDTDPELDVPADASLEAPADTTPAALGFATATDDTDPNPVVTYFDDENLDALGIGEITRTWTATDTTGNQATEDQFIEIFDTTEPEFEDGSGNNTFPDDITLEAPTDVTPANTGTATATDTVDPNPTVSFTDNVVSGVGDGSAPGVIERTWTATDVYDNENTDVQTITVVDTTAPEFKDGSGANTFPDDVILEAPSDVSPSNTGEATATDNIDPNPTVSFTDNVVSGPGDGSAPGVIERTWTATDAAGNSVSQIQTITVVDTTNPTVSAQNVVTNTDAGEAFATVDASALAATASDNSGTATISYSHTFPDQFQIGVTTVTVTATDPSGNTASTTATITVLDNENPTFTDGSGNNTFPDNVILEAPADVSPSNTGEATATDNSGVPPTVSFTDNVVSGVGDGSAPGVIERTWTATDASGNTVSDVQTITVVDTTAPEFKDGSGANTFPDDVILEAPSDVSPSNTGEATATDTVDPNPTVSFTDNVVSGVGDGSAPGVIERTWTATDAAGNTTTGVQTITIVDTIAPVFEDGSGNNTFPSDVTLEAPADVTPANTGTATATDNIDPNPTVSFTDNVVSGVGDGSAPGVIERTWTATDAAGNSVSQIQTITIVDTIAPVFEDGSGNNTFPSDVTLEAPADVTPANTGTATATDTVDPNPTVSFTDNVVSGVGDGSAPGVIERTWTATDVYDNENTDVQTITVVDTTAPEFKDGSGANTFPDDVILEAPSDVSPSNTGEATATDNIDPNPTVSFTDNVVSGPGDGSAPGVIERTWTATDAAGNSVSQIQTITVVDTTNPTVSAQNVVTNTDAGEAFATVDASALAATASDNSGTATISYSHTFPDQFQIGVTTVTVTATDPSGNTASTTATITVLDNENPTFTDGSGNNTFPDNVILEAPADVSPSNTGEATATDNSGVPPTVSFTDNVVSGVGDGSAPGVIERTWTATDASGNTVSDVQTITVVDTTAPEFKDGSGANTFPDDVILEAPSDVSPSNTGEATATDTVDPNPTVSFTDNVVSGVGDGSAPGVIERTWTATDAAGNTTTGVQTITIVDTIAPVFEDGSGNNTFPSDVTLEAPADVTPANTGTATATDNIDPNPTVSFTDNVVSGVGDGSAPGVIERTWTATDAAGNSVSQIQTITIVDTIAPVFEDGSGNNTFPSDVTLEAPADVTPANTGTATATDNIDPNPTVSFTDNVVSGVGDGSAPGVIERTWTATDAAGNSVSQIQTITIVDTIAPVFEDGSGNNTFPSDVTLEAPADVTPANTGTATATDNIDPNPTVSFTDNVVSGVGDGSAPGVIERTWTATDAAGNTTTGVQTITIVDTDTNITIDSPADGSTTTDNTPEITGTAEPGATVVVTIDGQTLTTTADPTTGAWTVTPTTIPDGTYPITATATDASGNTATDTITITIDATTNITIDSPADGSTTTDNTPEITGTAEPGATVVVTIDGQTLTTTADPTTGAWTVTPTTIPDGTYPITATATDASGNTATDTITITIDATTNITIDSPADGSTTTDNTPEITGTAEPGATVVVTIDGQTLTTTADPTTGAWTVTPTTIPDGTYPITATATDASGNTATDTITITISTAASADLSIIKTGEVIGSGTISVVVEKRVSSNNDDAEQDGKKMDLDSSDLDMNEKEYVGMRFNDLTIPQGATITNAYVQFTAEDEEGDTGNATVKIYAEDTDNASEFTSRNNDISSRDSTSSKVTWSVPDWNNGGDSGPAQMTPDLSSVIQEVVDRNGWQSGNSIAIIVEEKSGSKDRDAKAHDDYPTMAPLLHVEFESESSANAIIYNLAVTNNGPDDATDVVVVDDIPSEVEFSSFDNSCEIVGTTLECDISSVPVDTTVNLAITATIVDNNPGTVTNIAEVLFDGDANTDNNVSEVSHVLGTLDLPPVVSIDSITIDSVSSTQHKITGGGYVDDRHKFNLNIIPDDDSYDGHLKFKLSRNAELRSSDFTSVTFSNDASIATIEGTGKVNGIQVSYTAIVQDNGEPGTNDVFSIEIPSLDYELRENLTRGNIQIHSITVDDTTGFTATVLGTASDDIQLVSVSISLNGAPSIPVTGLESWSSILSGLEPGTHTIVVTATDSIGQTSTTTETFVIDAPTDDPPTITIDSPVDGSTVTESDVTISGTAGDDNTLVTVEVSLDGSVITSTGLETWSADVTGLADDTYTISATATDDAGQTTTVTSEFTVSTPTDDPPTITIDSPVDGSTVTESDVTISGTAGDDNTLVTVEVSLDGSVITSTGLETWSADVTGLADDTYTISATATDDAGQTTTVTSEFTVSITSPITITSIIRDFTPSHPDMQQGCDDGTCTGVKTGLVQNALGADGNPVFNNDIDSTNGAANFDQWYNHVSGVNTCVDYSMVLDFDDATGTYTFADGNIPEGFFPIDDQLFGNGDFTHNYHFTMKSKATFVYESGQFFAIEGADDDTFVFIDGTLVIDLGGMHPSGQATAIVNLDDLGLVEGEQYPLDLFFAERQSTGSHLIINTNIALSGVDQGECAVMPDDEFWIPIDRTSDDAEEGNNSDLDDVMKLESSDLDLVEEAEYVGLRFNEIPLERGQVIEHAYIQFTSEDEDYGTSTVTIYGEDSDNAQTFTENDGDISTRPTTIASVSWSIPDWDAEQAGEAQQTPELKSILQEIIDKPTWSAGNSVAFIIADGEGKDKDAHTFEDTPSKAAVLHITIGETPVDNPPTVSIDAPTDGAVITESDVTISGVASDDVSLATVEVSLDGTVVASTGLEIWSFDATGLTDGTHTISVTATDSLGQTATATSEFTIETPVIDNPPTVSIDAPTDGAVITESDVTISGVASDDVSLATVEVSLDGTVVASTGLETWSFDATGLTDGTHTISVTATDSLGQTATATSEFTINTIVDDFEFRGSFETPLVTSDGGWSTFANGAPGLLWTVSTASDDNDCVAELEIQHGILGGPDEATQHAELDAHCSIGISQTLETIAGETYELSYASKARPNTAPETNGLSVLINGQEINNISVMSSEWETSTHQFTATGPTTIEFVDVGLSDSYGTFLDDIVVIPSTVVPVDNPPTVSIDAPTDGAVITESDVTISGVASDDVSLATVEVSLDGTVVASTGLETWSFDATGLTDGTHTISVTATDSLGQTATATSEFTIETPVIDNPPTVSIDAPTDGAVITESDVTISGVASDDVSLATVEVSLDGTVVASTGLETWSFDATGLTDGTHTISVTATDSLGQTATATSEFTIETPVIDNPPTVSIDAPTDGAVITESDVTISGVASDDVSLATVEVSLDGTVVASTGLETWSFDATGLTDGTHTISVTATDSLGQTATATSEFTIETPVIDNPPTVSIDAPTDGAVITESDVTISGVASDDVSLATVEVSLDGTVVASTGLETWSFDATGLTDGTHTISVTATDSLGQTATATSEFTIEEPTLTKKQINQMIKDLNQQKKDINAQLKLDNNALTEQINILKADKKEADKADKKLIQEQINALKDQKKLNTENAKSQKSLINDEISELKELRGQL